MEAILIEVIKQVPAAGCMLVVVWYFLQYMKQERIDSREFLKTMAQECHVSQAASTAALSENTKMLGRAAHVVDTLESRHGIKPQVSQ